MRPIGQHFHAKIRKRQAKALCFQENLQMILTDTLNQPKALAIYALLGVIFGILYTLNYFTCAFMIKSKVYRHISQVLYVALYSLTFFAVTYAYFDYDLKIYHLLICLFFTTLTFTLLYLPIRKHSIVITDKCNALKSKVSSSKLVKRFKK